MNLFDEFYLGLTTIPYLKYFIIPLLLKETINNKTIK